MSPSARIRDGFFRIGRDSIVLRSCLHDNDTMHFLHVALVMPDHVHLIFTPLINGSKREFYSLAQIMCRIKGSSGQFINQKSNRLGRVWQTESFDHVLRSSESLDAKIAYILENPVRAGLVSEWKEYRWVWFRRERRDSPLGCPGEAQRAGGR